MRNDTLILMGMGLLLGATTGGCPQTANMDAVAFVDDAQEQPVAEVLPADQASGANDTDAGDGGADLIDTDAGQGVDSEQPISDVGSDTTSMNESPDAGGDVDSSSTNPLPEPEIVPVDPSEVLTNIVPGKYVGELHLLANVFVNNQLYQTVNEFEEDMVFISGAGLPLLNNEYEPAVGNERDYDGMMLTVQSVDIYPNSVNVYETGTVVSEGRVFDVTYDSVYEWLDGERLHVSIRFSLIGEVAPGETMRQDWSATGDLQAE